MIDEIILLSYAGSKIAVIFPWIPCRWLPWPAAHPPLV